MAEELLREEERGEGSRECDGRPVSGSPFRGVGVADAVLLLVSCGVDCKKGITGSGKGFSPPGGFSLDKKG